MKWNRYNYYTLLIPLVLGINTIVKVSAGIEIEQENLNSNGNETQELNKSRATSCKAFDKPGVHLIEVPGMEPFEVLCTNNSIAGPGWTVIQQRINGTEDFIRGWNSYRDGFGSFEGDFWLGLNRIHQITQSQRHELFIYMQALNGTIFYARYDNFKVGSESDKFAIQTLGEFKGTAVHYGLRRHEHKKFVTDNSDNHCLRSKTGGWWYSLCGYSNLNGRYRSAGLTQEPYIRWWVINLKMVQMLIRPN